MSNFQEIYKEFIALAKEKGITSAEKKQDEAAIAFLEQYTSKDEAFKNLCEEMEEIVSNMDFEKIWFVIRVQEILQDIPNCLLDFFVEYMNGLLDRYEKLQGIGATKTYILEYIIDILVDFPNEKMLPSIDRMCSLKVPLDDGYQTIFTCIKKSMMILVAINNEYTKKIFLKCLHHPSFEISEEVEDYYTEYLS